MMGNYLLIILGTLLSFNLFATSINVNTANRAVINTPKSIFESSVSLYTLNEEPMLQFDTKKLKEKLTSYYDTCFEDKNITYTLLISTYDQGNNDIPRYGKANGVKVLVVMNFDFFFKYTRGINYEIKEGAYGNI